MRYVSWLHALVPVPSWLQGPQGDVAAGEGGW